MKHKRFKHLKDQTLPTTIATAFKLVLASFNYTAGNTMRDPNGEEYRLEIHGFANKIS